MMSGMNAPLDDLARLRDAVGEGRLDVLRRQSG
jgi:hypothetical protein